MLYSLTDKLSFEDNPQIEIKGKVITVNADANTVLKLMDIVENEGETKGALQSAKLLFNDKDRKVIDSFKLSMSDYVKLIQTAMSLAIGEDPDEEKAE